MFGKINESLNHDRIIILSALIIQLLCKTDTFPSAIIWQVIFIHISLQHNNYRYDLPAATHFYVSSSQSSDADESILAVTV